MAYDIGILVFPDVQQLDLTGPYEVFATAQGVNVHLVWKDLDPHASATGLPLQATKTFADCPKLDVICVPGGRGVHALFNDDDVIEFVRRQAETANFITSVCTGSLVLGVAGLLQGKRATTHWNAMDLLAGLGAQPTNARTVTDGRLITAGGVTSGIDFALSVIAALCGEAEAKAVQLMLEYAPQPPFDAGTVETADASTLQVARERLSASRKTRQELIAAGVLAVRAA